jgi:hypothetical protein
VRAHRHRLVLRPPPPLLLLLLLLPLLLLLLLLLLACGATGTRRRRSSIYHWRRRVAIAVATATTVPVVEEVQHGGVAPAFSASCSHCDMLRRKLGLVAKSRQHHGADALQNSKQPQGRPLKGLAGPPHLREGGWVRGQVEPLAGRAG